MLFQAPYKNWWFACWSLFVYKVSSKHAFIYCIKYDSSEHMLSIRNEFEFVLPVYVSGPAEVGEGRAHIFSNTVKWIETGMDNLLPYIVNPSPPTQANFWLFLVPVYLRPTTAPATAAAVCPRSSSVVTLHTARTRRRRSPLQQCRQRNRRPSKKGGRESFIEMPEN